MQDRLITAAEAGRILGVSEESLANARVSGSINLNFKRVGGRVRYSLAEVNNYIERNTYITTSERAS